MGWTGATARAPLWRWLLLLLAAWSAAQAATTAESAGRLLSYQELVTPSGMKVLLVQDLGLDRAELTVHVPFGSFHEPRESGGLAHLREHLVGYAGSPESEAFIPWVKRQAFGEHWFKTRDKDTVYFAAAEAAKGRELVERLRRALLPRAYRPADVRQQIAELEREWRKFQGQEAQILEQLESFAAEPTHPVAHFRSGGESSMPLSRAEELAMEARQMTEAQHTACALSWAFVAPLPLAEMKQVFEAATQESLAPVGTAVPCRARNVASARARPLWQKTFAGRLASIDGFDQEDELWLVLASTDYRSHDAGAFWVSQLEGGQASSLRRQLQGLGWIKDLRAHFDPRYYGTADRWWLRLHLTEAGKGQLPAVRRLIDTWWHQGRRDGGGALQRYETLMSDSRRWSPVASRAQWGFQIASALSRCSGPAIFQDCEPSVTRSAHTRTLPPLRSRELSAWQVPHERAQRLAWLGRWQQQPPHAQTWVAAPAKVRISNSVPLPPFPGIAASPNREWILAEWGRQGWAVCQHPRDAREPFVATVEAHIDLAAFDEAERVRILMMLEWGRSPDGVLGPLLRGFGQTLEWRLHGTTVALLARGRRDWQLSIMHAWLQHLGLPPDAHAVPDEALQAVRVQAGAGLQDPVFDALVAQMARDAGQEPSHLSGWIQAWDRAQRASVRQDSSIALPSLVVRLWVEDGVPRPEPPQRCEASPPSDRPWNETGPVTKLVPLPPGSNVSALLLRCGPFDAKRFWVARQSRSALQFQLRTLAREQGLDIAFISVAAFTVPQGTCWGAFAEAVPGAVPDLAGSLRQLLSLRASLFREGLADAAKHSDWRLPIPSCDAAGWSQIWGMGWPDALAHCPFHDPGAGGRRPAGDAIEEWLGREWAGGQTLRVYLGTPALNAD